MDRDEAFPAKPAARAGFSETAEFVKVVRESSMPRRELYEMEIRLGHVFQQELLGGFHHRSAHRAPPVTSDNYGADFEAALDAGGYGVMRIYAALEQTIGEDLDQLQRMLRSILSQIGMPQSERSLAGSRRKTLRYR